MLDPDTRVEKPKKAGKYLDAIVFKESCDHVVAQIVLVRWLKRIRSLGPGEHGEGGDTAPDAV